MTEDLGPPTAYEFLISSSNQIKANNAVNGIEKALLKKDAVLNKLAYDVGIKVFKAVASDGLGFQLSVITDFPTLFLLRKKEYGHYVDFGEIQVKALAEGGQNWKVIISNLSAVEKYLDIKLGSGKDANLEFLFSLLDKCKAIAENDSAKLVDFDIPEEVF